MMQSPHFITKALQRKLYHEFGRNAVQKGFEYFLQQAVVNVMLHEFTAKAEVIGTEIYQTQLNWKYVKSTDEVTAKCTCPHFEEGNFCKHLWAFILELDRTGLSKHIAIPTYVDLAMDDDLDADDTSSTKDFEIVNSINQLPEQKKISPITIEKASNWRSIFKQPPPKPKNKLTVAGTQIFFMTLESDKYKEASVKLNFFISEQNPTGTYAMPRPFALPENGQVKLGNLQLESALQAISTLAKSEMRDTYRYSGYFPDPCSRSLRLSSLHFLFSSLLETGRVYASRDEFIQSMHEQKRANLLSGNFSQLTIRVHEADSGYSMTGFMNVTSKLDNAGTPAESNISAPIHEIKKFVDPNLFRWKNHIGFIELADSEQLWFEELVAGSLLIPNEDSEAFLEAILNQSLKFSLPQSLTWEEAKIKPEPRLELTLDKSRASSSSNEQILQNRYLIDLKFQYGPRNTSYSSLNHSLPSFEDRKIYCRDAEEEVRIFGLLPHELMRAGARNKNSEDIPYVHSKNLIEFAKAALSAGIPITIENKKIQEANDFQISVTSGVDWFEVEGEANFCGRWVKFPAILESVKKGENFVPLPDGSMGLMSEQMTERLNKFANFAENSKDGFRFGKAQGLILNSLLENETNVKLDADFKRLREKIKNFSGIKTSEPPASFQGKLRKYQKDGLGWLNFLETYELGGILADDMGLGKTIQCLAFLENRRSLKKRRGNPSLLIAPKSLLPNWQSEAAKFTPEMRVHIHAGLERETTKEFFKKQDLVVTTYQTMLRDLDTLKEMSWDCLILDEAQAIKNPEALISKGSKMLPSKFRLAMTGTPIENSIQDLFSISDFVNPGFLNGKNRTVHLKLSDDLKETLSRAFKPVLLRRTKEQVLKDLPEKTEQLISVELESKQLKAYNELKRYYQNQLMTEIKEKGVNKSKIKILAALTRLRQAALHPGLIDPGHSKTKSAKFEVVLEMLDDVISEDHRVLIFSQFTSLLGLLKKELDQRKIKYCYLDGKTAKRQEVVGEFKSQDVPVFLMSLKAGGVGLNLVEADYVFLLDPWWNPAVEAQAIDRVHRIGQKRAVNAYRFIAKNTVEEKILELQQTKKGISAEIFGAKSNLIRNLTAMDIENLLT
jgi:superfamily II DNA or RNA helicase